MARVRSEESRGDTNNLVMEFHELVIVWDVHTGRVFSYMSSLIYRSQFLFDTRTGMHEIYLEQDFSFLVKFIGAYEMVTVRSCNSIYGTSIIHRQSQRQWCCSVEQEQKRVKSTI